MTKLFQINTVVNHGSTGRITEEIGKLAANHGWISYIAYGRKNSTSSSNLIKIGNNADILLHVIHTRLFDRHGLASINATHTLIREIEETDPDIIHLHNIHGYYINIELLFKYLASTKKPIVWTLHDCWPFTGHCTHFAFVQCEKWKNQCFQCPQIHEYPKSLFMDKSSQNFSLKRSLFTLVSNMTIVTVSKWLGDMVNLSFLNKYPVKIIQNGIDTDIFSPKVSLSIREKYQLESKFVMIGVASIWGLKKGINDFMRLSKLLNDDERIILVGLNDSQLKLLPNNIIGFKQIKDQNQLAEFYSLADIVLNLSVEETFGLTTVEGFSCGTPAIAYNSTASPELITDKTGIVLEANDLNGVRVAINQIRNKGKEYYSTSCRNLAVSKYDKNNKFNEYLKLYNELL